MQTKTVPFFPFFFWSRRPDCTFLLVDVKQTALFYWAMLTTALFYWSTSTRLHFSTWSTIVDSCRRPFYCAFHHALYLSRLLLGKIINRFVYLATFELFWEFYVKIKSKSFWLFTVNDEYTIYKHLHEVF